MATTEPEEAQLPKFYAGKDIFITGATGFLGKVAVERLLSTCPDIGRLYLLVRQKRGVSPAARLATLKQSQAFDILRINNPSQLDKLVVVPGDVTQPQLGIAAESLALMQNVSVVFHNAATLKFDEALRTACDHNLRSVLRLLELCDTLPQLQVVVHVSTAYSNSERSVVQEVVYPPPVCPRLLLQVADSLPEHLLEQITPQYISPKPNTYTFTKALAEWAAYQHHELRQPRYSLAIFRPTIVISSVRHPAPGWLENLNGPSGAAVGAGAGLLHVFRGDLRLRADLLPADVAAGTMLAVAWDLAPASDSRPGADLGVGRGCRRVYACSAGRGAPTWGHFTSALRRELRAAPYPAPLWYPFGTVARNKYVHRILECLLQTVPLYLVEYIAKLLGIKTRISLIAASRKLRAMNRVLEYFSMREWHFHADNVRRLREKLSDHDRMLYNLDPDTIDWEQHLKDFVLGSRRYLLKEKDENLPQARINLRRLRVLHYTVIFLMAAFIFRLFLRNQLIHDLVYGFVGQLLSLLHSAYALTRDVRMGPTRD